MRELATTTPTRRRHSWVSTMKSRVDPDHAYCRHCGLQRYKEFLEPTYYTLTADGRSWIRAPNCPPETD
jgi:hypothetical protein